MNRNGKAVTPLQRAKLLSSCRHTSGFTITELMVVITIMAVLSAILLPALNKGRSRSQSISCLNNLRQLTMAWQMYGDDHNTLAANNYVNGYKLGNLKQMSGESWCPGNALTDTTTENIRNGLLYRYIGSTGIYRCPADNSKVDDTAAEPILRTRSYKMSGSMNCTVIGNPTYQRPTELLSLQPERLFVFIDAHEDAMIDGHFTLPTLAEGYKMWIDMPSDRHDGAGNLSFADGHIERWRWTTAKKFKQWQQPITSVDELSDLRRLQAVMRQTQ